MADYANKEVLVSTQWVADHSNDPKVRLVEVDVDTSAYDQGHVPGAVGWNWQTQLQDQVRRDLIDQASFEKLLGASGISNDTTIIFYGDNNNWFACFAYWVAKMYGHASVRIMNGGRKKWELEKRELATDEPQPTPTQYKAAAPDLSLRARQNEVQQSLGKIRGSALRAELEDQVANVKDRERRKRGDGERAVGGLAAADAAQLKLRNFAGAAGNAEVGDSQGFQAALHAGAGEGLLIDGGDGDLLAGGSVKESDDVAVSGGVVGGVGLRGDDIAHTEGGGPAGHQRAEVERAGEAQLAGKLTSGGGELVAFAELGGVTVRTAAEFGDVGADDGDVLGEVLVGDQGGVVGLLLGRECPFNIVHSLGLERHWFLRGWE